MLERMKRLAATVVMLVLSLACTPNGGGAPSEGESRSAKAAANCEGHAPGEKWKASCNECVCSDAGEAVCSRMDCSAQPTKALGKNSQPAELSL